MRLERKHAALALVLFGFVCSLSLAQKTESSTPVPHGHTSRRQATLTPDDGLSVIAAALDSRARADRQSDCSHLVHAIYERAGFSYPYASSSDLYRSTENFRRVAHPQPGDLVVWSGHVGIIVNPARHVFFSTLSDGPGIDTYDAQYWKARGPVRFYRYIKAPARASKVKSK